VEQVHRRQVGVEGLQAVDGLEQHEVGDLRRPAPAGGAHPRRQGLAPVAQHAHHLGHQARQARMGPDGHAGRQEGLVERHPPVRLALLDAQGGDAHVAAALLPLEHQPQAQPPHLDPGGLALGAGGVAHLHLAGEVAGHHLGVVVGAHLAAAGTARRHGQVDDLVVGVLGHVQGQGGVVLARHVEGGAVGQHPHGPGQCHLAQGQQLGVQLQAQEPPAEGPDGGAARADQVLDVAVLLLEVVRPQEQPLRPDDLVGPGHAGRATA